MWDLLTAAAAERPDEVLLADDDGRRLTARQWLEAAEGVAAWLHGAGMREGDVLSWQLPTVLEVPVLMAACARLGVVQNPLIVFLRDAEVGLITSQLATKMYVTAATWRGFDHAAMARSFVDHVVALDLHGAADLLRLPMADPTDLPAQTTDDGRCRWVYYSSGTTSHPKGAKHSNASVAAGSNAMIGELGLGSGHVYPIAWPLAHIGGMAMLGAVLRRGGKLVLFDTWDPSTTPERMAAHHPTVLGSATPFFNAYVDAQRRHGDQPLFPDVSIVVGGGAPVAQETNRRVVEALGVAGITGAWGLTEFPCATTERPTDTALGTTVGWPASGVQVKVVDGELRLRGPQCFLGYVDATLDAEAFDTDGWFRTGDLGNVADDGRVSISGRLKDVIIRNAENISAAEVEEVVLTHPDVADVAVVGLPDDRSGERVCAIVVLRGEVELDVAELADHCAAAGLARYKAPEQVVVRSNLPRNSMGKTLKQQLRDEILATVRD